MSDEQKTQESFLNSKPIRMMLALVSIIIVATAALEAAYMSTKDVIAHNKQITIQKRVLDVLGVDRAGQPLAQLFKARVEQRDFPQPGGKTLSVWLGKDSDGSLMGYAVRMRGGGFQGIVDIVVGLTPDLGKTTGMEVIESGETPGLGDEMRKPAFRNQFYDGVVTTGEVEFVKYRDPDKDGQFRAITGATYTSTAIKTFLNAALEQLRTLKVQGALEL